MVDSAAGRVACVLVLDAFEAGCVLRAVRLAQATAAIRDAGQGGEASAYWLARSSALDRVAGLLELGATLGDGAKVQVLRPGDDVWRDQSGHRYGTAAAAQRVADELQEQFPGLVFRVAPWSAL